jgi:hypothetical protein
MPRLDFSCAPFAGRGRRLQCRAKRRRQPLHGRFTAGRSRIHKKDGKCGAARFLLPARLNMERIAHIFRQVGSARRLRCISLQARATLQKICRLLVLLRAGGVAGRQSHGPRTKQASNIAHASAAASSGQGRVSLCRARHERGGGEAGERGQQARGAQPRVHAVVSDVLYWLRVA